MLEKGKKQGKRIIAIIMTLIMLMTFSPVNFITLAALDDTSVSTDVSETDKDNDFVENNNDELTNSESSGSAESTEPAEQESDLTEESTKDDVTVDVTVTVTGVDSTAIENATVTIGEESYKTDSEGKAVFTGLAAGAVEVLVEKDGYKIETETVIVSADSTAVNVTLRKYYKYIGIVEFPTDAEEDKVYSVEAVDSDNNKAEVTCSDNSFEAMLLENATYTVTVNPANEKLLKSVAKTVSDKTENAEIYEIKYVEYNIYCNGNLCGTARYGEKYNFSFKNDEENKDFTLKAFTVKCGDNDVEYEFTNDNKDVISFYVTGDIVITSSYEYAISVDLGENGSTEIKVNDDVTTIRENGVVSVPKGTVASYTVKADIGYYIKEIKFQDNAILASSNETKYVEYSGSLNTFGKFEVIFAPIEFTFNVILKKDAKVKGGATLSGDSWSITIGGSENSNTATVKVSDSNKGKYSIGFSTYIDGNYEFKFGKNVKEENGKYIVTAALEDIDEGNGKKTAVTTCEVEIEVVAKKYTLTCVDPIGKNTEKTVFTADDDDVKLPTGTVVDGLKLIGWSEEVPDERTKAISTFACSKQTGDAVLYAVYAVESVSVRGQSTNKYEPNPESSEHTKTTDYVMKIDSDTVNGFADTFFGNDVSLELSHSVVTGEDNEINVVVSAGSEELNATDGGKYTIANVVGSTKETKISVNITVKYMYTYDETDLVFVYTVSEPVEFTVKQDSVDPTLEVKDTENKKEGTCIDVITCDDKYSGVAKVQYTVIDLTDEANEMFKLLAKVKNGKVEADFEETIENIKAELRALAWTDIEISENIVNSYDKNDDNYVVYRVIDRAGNDVYSSFDRTIPSIINVGYSFNNNSGEVNTGDGSIYTNGDVKVVATVIDKNLFFSNDDSVYNDCYLRVNYKDSNGNNEYQPIKTTEKFSLFYDKWEVEFIIPYEDACSIGYADQSASFEIIAADQTGNFAQTYTLNGEMVFESISPEITVTYDYVNHSNSINNFAFGEVDSFYSMDRVTANITVTGTYFDPYADESDAKNSAIVKVSINGKDVDVEFEKTKSSWTGKYSIDSESEEEFILSVSATSQAGNASSYKSGSIYVDKINPVINVEYACENEYRIEDDNKLLKLYYGINSLGSNTASVKISDNYLAPYNGTDRDASTANAELTLLRTSDTEEEKESDAIDNATCDFVYSKESGEYIGSMRLGEKEGTYMFNVDATDEAGNKATYSFTELHSDRTPPVITSVTMKGINDNAAAKIGHILTFGTFFRESVEITATCTDGDYSFSSGARKMTLEYEGAEEGRLVSDVKDNKALFTIPVGELGDVNGWNANISFKVEDNTNNESDIISLEKVNPEDGFSNNYVLYETDKPEISTSFDEDKAEDTFYIETVDEKTTYYWLKLDKDIVIDVFDCVSTDVAYSGLAEVTVKYTNNDGLTDKKTYLYNEKELVGVAEYTFVYNATDEEKEGCYILDEGKNTISITAADNAGNIMEEVTYIVYKDVKAPKATDIKINANGKESKGNNLAFGNYYNGDVKLTVSSFDEAFSSGIKEINVTYIYDDGKVLLKELATLKPETLSSVDGSDIEMTRIFELDYIENAEGYFVIELVDNVGNEYRFGEDKAKISDTDIKGNIKLDHLMFEKTPTNINLSASDPVFVCKNKDGNVTKWYNTADITISSYVTDRVGANAISGLNNFVMSLNGEAAVTKSLDDGFDDEEKIVDDNTEINLKGCGEDKSLKAVDGANIINVTTVDNAENKSSDEIEVCVDRKKPSVTAFSFKIVSDKEEYTSEKCSAVTVTDYGFFFSEDTEVTVYAKDSCPSSGIKEIHFAAEPVYNEYNGQTLTKIVDQVSTECETECKFTESTEGGTVQTSFASFIVPAGFKGQIYAYVIDNVNNDSLDGDADNYENWKHPDGLIVETQEMHNAHESIAKHITIAEKTSPVKYLAGDKNPLYNDNAEVTITVIDTYSGIKDVEYTVEAAYDTGNNYSYAFKDITPESSQLKDWEYSTELNLVTTMRRTITVSNNSNDIKVTVKITDNSGNISEEEFILSIDKDAPIITVTFDKADFDDDENYTGYFNQDRKLTVSIKERNFDFEKVIFTVEKELAEYNIYPTSLSDYSYTPSDAVVNGENIQFFNYVYVHNFTEDGDYTFAIEATDQATNRTADENVDYGTAAAKEVAKVFTIDKTAPVIDIAVSGTQDSNAGIYYKDGLEFTVRITEHNYAPERYEAKFVVKKPVTEEIDNTVNVQLANETHNGDEHIYVYKCEAERIYELNLVTVVDMASNSTTNEDEHKAALDKNLPKVEINYYVGDNEDGSQLKELTDKTATNAEMFAPVITIEDAFLDTSSADSYTLSLMGNYNGNVLSNTNGDSLVSYVVSTAENADVNIITITFNNFANIEEIDDIYTLKITAKDQAGRHNNDEGDNAEVIFSVNRFGSTFMVGTRTNDLINKYYSNKEQEIKLIQINAAEIEEGRISTSRNGVTKDLQEGTNYTAVNSEPVNIAGNEGGTSTGWYECVYNINANNFVEEGIYDVTVYTSDSADNTISSVISKRKLNVFVDNDIQPDDSVSVEGEFSAAPVNFLIDKTEPTVRFSDLKEETEESANDIQQYFSGLHEFAYYAEDDVKLASVALYVTTDRLSADDIASEKYTPVSFYSTGDNLTEGKTFIIKEDKKTNYNYVTVVATDMAGNSHITYATKVQVTTNPIKWFMANTIAKMIAATLLIAAIIVIIILVKRKKDKTKELAQ